MDWSEKEALRAGHMLLGAVSDTHGKLHRGLVEAFRGVDLILHAGDVGLPSILTGLEEIAPVRAVRGNVDTGAWARSLPRELDVDLPGGTAYLIHILGSPERPVRAVRRRLAENAPRLILFGHTHEPLHEVRDGVHFLNPGSAGPARWGKPVSCARVKVSEDRLEVERVDL